MAQKERSYKIEDPQQPRNVYIGVIIQRSSRVHDVFVGGQRKGCVQIIISKRGKHTIEGTLLIEYDRRCNIEGTLERGTGTIHLLRTAIAFAYQMYPNLQEIHLLDHSYIQCHGKRMYLAPQQLTMYGKTWYERHINAVLEKVADQKRLNDYRHHILTKPDWEQIESFIKASHIPEKVISRMKSLYLNAKTLKEYIANVKEILGCTAYEKWLPAYVNHMLSPFDIHSAQFVVRRGEHPVRVFELPASPYSEGIQVRKQIQNEFLAAALDLTPRHKQ